MDGDEVMLTAVESALAARGGRTIWGPDDPAPAEASVRGLRRWRPRQRHATGLHHHPNPEVCIALSGPAVLEVGATRYAVEPPMAAVLLPGVNHCESWRRRDRRYRLLWLVTLGEGVLAAAIEYSGDGRWITLTRDWVRSAAARGLYRALTDPDLPRRGRRDLLLSAWLLPVLAELHRDRVATAGDASAAEAGPSAADELAVRVREVIDGRLDRRMGVEELARMMHVSPSYLHRAFRHRVGESLYGYAIRVRMEEAMRLLKSTDLLVKQVAGKVGYDDPLHFSRQFHRYHGVAPTGVRGHGNS